MRDGKPEFTPNLELIGARKSAGLVQEALARAVGTTQSQIAKMERGERSMSAEWAAKLGRVLKVDPATLLPRDVRAAFVATEGHAARGLSPAKALSAVVPGMPIHSFRFSVPRPDGRKVLEKETMGETPIPSYLAGVPNAYALVMPDESMVPRYRPGQILHMHPLRPATQGAAVLMKTTDGSSLICEWGGWEPGGAIVSTYSGGQIVVPAAEIEGVHVVVGSEEAF